MIRTDRPFVLFAEVSVLYKGRARSTLDQGRYLIIRKGDGTLLIHGNSLTKTLNYQPPGATVSYRTNGLRQIISQRGTESIIINVHDIIHYYEPNRWADGKIAIVDTESDLRNKLISEISKYISNVHTTFTEYKTPLGPIDLLVVSTDAVLHIIELKRKKANISACSQLMRYVSYFKNAGKECRGYVASPEISSNALKYLQDNGHRHIQIDF